MPVTDGSNGQLLKTNGAGVLTWSNDNSGSGSGWSLTGNSGTSPSTNFIGTTDGQPLIFKVNNIRAGFINNSTYNTSFGYQALISGTTGNFNTANGYASLQNNASGVSNTAAGYYSLLVTHRVTVILLPARCRLLPILLVLKTLQLVLVPQMPTMQVIILLPVPIHLQ